MSQMDPMNQYQQNQNTYNPSKSAAQASQYIAKTYLWLFAGLLVSFGVGFTASNSSYFQSWVFQNPAVVWGILIAYLIVSIVMIFSMFKLSSKAATVLYFIYAIVQGFSLSLTLMMYELSSAIFIFAITAGIFGVMGVFGMVTKKDLSGWGTALMFSLLGLIVMSIIGIFLRYDTYQLIINIAGVVIFTLYTAFDTQRMKRYFTASASIEADEKQKVEAMEKGSIMMAFSLLLNFVNIFIRLLAIMGKRK